MITEYVKDALRAKKTALKDILKSERNVIFFDNVKNDQIFNDHIIQLKRKKTFKSRV